MSSITRLRPIESYEAPSYLVRPKGRVLASPRTIARALPYGYDVIESDIMGWGPYNAIVRARPEHDEDVYTPLTPYLAVIHD